VSESDFLALQAITTAEITLLVGDDRQMPPWIPAGLEPYRLHGLRSATRPHKIRAMADISTLEFSYRSQRILFWNAAAYEGKVKYGRKDNELDLLSNSKFPFPKKGRPLLSSMLREVPKRSLTI
jgi:hypothetical protein